MAVDEETLGRLDLEYEHAVIVTLDADGYPLGVATGYRTDTSRGVVVLDRVSADVAPSPDREVNVIFSHVRPQPGMGYDERRYVSLWGTLRESPGGLELTPERSQSWNEKEIPFFQYSEVSVPQARGYLVDLSERQGRQVKPQLSRGWLFLRATRLPFVTAAALPVLLGVAVASLHLHHTVWWAAILTLIGAICVHLGLNIANDVFDTLSGADAANQTPTQFSGGSRVIHYGLMSLRQMVMLSALFYGIAIVIGFVLAFTRGFWPIFGIGVAGVAISIAYTAPPFRLVHRGLGEICVALGFGPIMVLGASYVQEQRFTFEAFYVSLPLAILIALVLYVNEIPDRAGDAAAGKRTLPVRLSKEGVINVYVGSIAATYLLIAVGGVADVIVRPTLLALLTIPMALKVYRGMRQSYEDPYALMPTMGVGVNLHLATGLLLFAGYVIAIVASHLMATPPFFLR
ncbi:MAG: prenyltransferase [Actinomycetota bacterium]